MVSLVPQGLWSKHPCESIHPGIGRRVETKDGKGEGLWKIFFIVKAKLGLVVSNNRGCLPPKWMVYFMENPIKMDDLGGKKPTIFVKSPSCKGFSLHPKRKGSSKK